MLHPTEMTTKPFEQFVFHLRQHPQIKIALSYLRQRHHEMNHLLLFYAVWFASFCYGRLNKQHFKTLQSEIYLWHDRVILELEYLLKTLKNTQNSKLIALQSYISNELLAAEKMEADILANIEIKTKQIERKELHRFVDGCYNLLTYFKFLNIGLSSEDEDACILLLQNVFGYLAPIEVADNFKKAVAIVKGNAQAFSQLTLKV